MTRYTFTILDEHYQHLRRLLLRRNATIKELAEGEGWRDYLPERARTTS